MTPQGLAEHLGGRQALGRDIRSDFDLSDAIRAGLPPGGGRFRGWPWYSARLRTPCPRHPPADAGTPEAPGATAQPEAVGSSDPRCSGRRECGRGHRGRGEGQTLVAQTQPLTPRQTAAGPPGQRCGRSHGRAGPGLDRSPSSCPAFTSIDPAIVRCTRDVLGRGRRTQQQPSNRPGSAGDQSRYCGVSKGKHAHHHRI